ncbi:MAG: hypothetical protein FWD90_12305 [Defluviitaleaceae bacterium]|nr:hypothetical protein [Defluviitaleaceae bacterium]
MVVQVARFFDIIGVDMTPPSNMQELIPYMMTVMIGVFIVGGVFKVIGAIASSLFEMRRM